MEACVAHLQATADELAAAGADRETIVKALLEVIEQIADEDRIGAEVFLENVAALLEAKIEDAGSRGDKYEIRQFVAAQKKPKPEPTSKSKAKRKPRKKK
jgi:hypothetical protein